MEKLRCYLQENADGLTEYRPRLPPSLRRPDLQGLGGSEGNVAKQLAEGDRLRTVIASRRCHLANLQRGRRLGKLNAEEREEYRRKSGELRLLRNDLRRIEQRGWTAWLPPGQSLEVARDRLSAFVDQVFSWLHPPLADQSAVERRGLPAEQVALRWVLRKNPSLSRLMWMMEESRAWIGGVARSLGHPVLLTLTWAIFPDGDGAERAAAGRAFDQRFAKMNGRLPWVVLPPGRWREIEVFRARWRKVRALRALDHFLEVLFSNGDHWRFPRRLSNWGPPGDPGGTAPFR
ncbi:MAG: hypothetical protein NTV14_06995 [Coprothermobacterota bacterium]|nr:hypothetical protein [Coprothermobacterota bacterium]